MKSEMSRLQKMPAFELRVGLEAAKGENTMSELSSRFEIQAFKIQEWKKQLLEEGSVVFEHRGRSTPPDLSLDSDA